MKKKYNFLGIDKLKIVILGNESTILYSNLMPMLLKNTFLLLTFSLLLFACKNNEECKECEEEQLAIEVPKVIEKKSDQEIADIKADEKAISEGKNVDINFKENKKKIVEKFGEQWTFCACVRANDSLDKLIKSGAELNDAFMNRFDEVDKKCKAFLVMSNNSTPDERKAHNKKTKDCLKSTLPVQPVVPSKEAETEMMN